MTSLLTLSVHIEPDFSDGSVQIDPELREILEKYPGASITVKTDAPFDIVLLMKQKQEGNDEQL